MAMSNAFPVIYARDVRAAASFYERLGFEQHYQFPTENRIMWACDAVSRIWGSSTSPPRSR
jgi:predicted lactoylglutathione lyase